MQMMISAMYCMLVVMVLATAIHSFQTRSVTTFFTNKATRSVPSLSVLQSSKFGKNNESSPSIASSLSSSSSDAADTGRFQVDMNRYNLPLEQIAQEWTANLVPQSSLREEGIYLGAKSSKDIMVDTVKVSFRRQPSLGVQLLEIAGGRSDGLGITVIDGIVPGGAAEGTDIQLGDSIAAISVITTQRQSSTTTTTTSSSGGVSDIQIATSISTECFGYDKLVEAIQSLPPPESDNEFILLTLKRLRRKPKVSIQLQYPPAQNEPDVTIELFAGENLRRAMLTRGIKLNDKLSRRFDSGGTGDCGADGTCATCVVAIVQGDDLVSPQGIQEKQILIKNPRWRLACKATVGYGYQEGEMTIRVNPRQW